MEEERVCKVYMHKCIYNNLIYYGITGLPKLLNRWGSNGYGYKNNKNFWKDIVKFGWKDGFIHELLYDNLTRDEALKIEHDLIMRDKTYLKKFGYNISKGGGYGSSKTIEVIEKMRLNSKNKKAIICLNTGDVFYSIHEAGRKLNINFKNISAVCNKTKKSIHGLKFCFIEDYDPDIEYDLRYGGDYHNKSIIHLETKKIYKSIISASKELKIHPSSISSNCYKKRKSAGNQHFMFLKDYDKNKDYELPIFNNKRKIVCINNNKIFDSIADAGRYFNIPKKCFCHISDVCKNKIYSIYNLRFCYIEDYNEDLINKKLIRKNCKKVICVETQEVFNSIKECAEQLNLSKSKIGAVCSKKRKTTGGFHFEYYIDKN